MVIRIRGAAPVGKFVGETFLQTFTADGQGCVTLTPGPEPRISVRELATGNVLRSAALTTRLLPQLSRSDRICISPDGQRVAWDSDGRLHLGELQATPGAARRRINQASHPGIVRSVAASPDGRVIASTGDDQNVCFWEAGTGQSLELLDGFAGVVSDALFSRDGSLLILDTASGKPVRTFAAEEPAGKIQAVTFHPRGQTYAVGRGNGRVEIRDWASDRLQRSWLTGQGEVRALAFHPEGTILGVAGRGVSLWDPERGVLQATLGDDASRFHTLIFSRDGDALVAAGEERLIHAWSIKDMQAAFARLGLDCIPSPACPVIAPPPHFD